MKKSIFLLFFYVLAVNIVWAQDIEVIPIDDNSQEESTPKKVNAEEKYLEMAVGYINDKNFEAARRYIQMAQASNDEKIFKETLVWSMYLDALEGKTNMESTVNSLEGDLNSKALYYISEGWQSYFEKNPEAKKLFSMSIEYKEKLIAKSPDSEWALLASMQLVPLYINERNYDKALNYLLEYLDRVKKTEKKEDQDKAWFYLGQILENSKEYRDLHKAIKAYQMVTKNKDSFYYSQAVKRIEAIEKFYNIIP